jgi:hypothetical protein
VSIDKPPGSGSTQPDQPQRPGHKPFPGQPDRPQAAPPPPTDNRTADQLRAERAQYTSVREYAQAKETEKTAAAGKTEATGTGPPGTAPHSAPARGDSGGQHPATPQDRGPGARQEPPTSRRADALTRTDAPRHRPFPGQPDRPQAAPPPPADNRTADQLRAERAQYTSVREYAQAKETEKTAAAHESSDPATTEKTSPARTVPRSPHEEAPAAETPAARPDSPHAAHSTRGVSEPGSDQHSGQPEQHEGTSPTGRNGGIETGQPQERPGPTHDADTAARPDGSAPQRRQDDGPPAEGTHGPHLSWITLPPEARTVGDTTSTGIGRKPDGDQLRDMEGDRPKSPMDLFVDNALDRVDDIHDAAGDGAQTIQDFRQPGPAPGAHHGYVVHDVYTSQVPPGLAVNDVAGSVAVMAVAVLAGANSLAHHFRRKEHEP